MHNTASICTVIAIVAQVRRTKNIFVQWKCTQIHFLSLFQVFPTTTRSCPKHFLFYDRLKQVSKYFFIFIFLCHSTETRNILSFASSPAHIECVIRQACRINFFKFPSSEQSPMIVTPEQHNFTS